METKAQGRMDIVEVARELGLEPRKKGKDYYCQCPVEDHEHDNTDPKCGLDQVKGFNCLKCQDRGREVNGDALGLIKLTRNCSAREAYDWAEEQGLKPPPEWKESKHKKAAAKLQELLQQHADIDPVEQWPKIRSFEESILREDGVKAEGTVVSIPMRDANLEVCGYRQRRGNDHRFAGERKCLTNPGGKNGVLCPPDFPDRDGRILVVEGETDYFRARTEQPERRVIGIPGKSPGRNTLQTVAQLLDGEPATLCPDPGARGVMDEVAAQSDAADVKMIEPDPDVGDLDDRIQDGADLNGLMDGAVDWEPSSEDKAGFLHDAPAEDLTIQEKLVRLMEAVDLVQTPEGEAWAIMNDGRGRQLDRSGEFSAWLSDRYMEGYGKPPRSGDLSDVVRAFIGRARRRGSRQRIYTRVARTADSIYIDLGRNDNAAVEITADGWQVIPDPPVIFRTSSALAPLPEPDSGAGAEDLDALMDILSVSPEDAFLTAGWMLGTLQPDTPYPILILTGAAGAGKSTATKILRYLVDPAGPDGTLVTGRARDAKDVFAAANGSHVLALDNITSVPQWLSDTLAAIATGAGQATRRLYTDSDLAVVQVRKPTLINGISIDGLGNDFMDRAISINLEAPEQKQAESKLWRQVKDEAPRLLAGLCEAASYALRNEQTVALGSDELPRMADFATWIKAAEDALHQVEAWSDLDFLEVYADNREEASEGILESDPVGATILDLTREGNAVKCTAAELLDKLETRLRQNRGDKGDGIIRGSQWPSSAISLGKKLRRLKPALENAGYRMSKDRRTWWIDPGCPF